MQSSEIILNILKMMVPSDFVALLNNINPFIAHYEAYTPGGKNRPRCALLRTSITRKFTL